MIRHALLAAALLAACAPEVADDPIETDTAEDTDLPDPWAPCGGLCACVAEALLQCPAPPPSEGCESTPAGLFLGLWLQECGTTDDLWGA